MQTETQQIKQKYEVMMSEDMGAAKSAYADDLGKVLESL